jgi:DNA polymerase
MGDRLSLVAAEAARCTACALSQTRTTVVFGAGDPDAELLILGEAPGREEDLSGQPFVGRSGRLLDQLLSEELERSRAAVYVANVVKCRPPGNRDPLPGEVAACRGFLEAQIADVGPKVIITLGNFAMRALLETSEGITRARGRSYPFASGVVIPTYHPAAALRGGARVLLEMRADFARARSLLAGVSA